MRMLTTLFALFLLVITSAPSAQGYDALVRQAESRISDGSWEEALALYEKALETGEFSYNDYYNSAVACARLDRREMSYSYLFKAVHAGLLDREHLEQDPDLEAMRNGEEWQSVIASVEKEQELLDEACPETRSAGPVMDLPEPRLEGSVSVEEALQNRRSIRSYSDEPLTLDEVSQLLWAAYGITKTIEGGPAFIRGGLRAAPSAGARYPLDIYLAAFNVTDLPSGIYLYRSETHQLMRIVEGDTRPEISKAAFDQMHFETASAAIIYSAVFERTTVKYGDRGRERYVCMDLGHSAENVYLQAHALGIGTCAIGAFTDLWLKKACRMTREEEPIYIMPLGRMELQ